MSLDQNYRDAAEREQQYRDTIIRERSVKKVLVKKLEDIKSVVHHYTSKKHHSSSSKAAGIPFAYSGSSSSRDAKRALLEIKNILDKK
tara:strand:- start:13817 stop:14080 length:264 start_codon:yes stop_codon:yes gene_type:complete